MAAAKKKTDEKVTIKIPRFNKDQEDVVVWVNQKRYLIKRGVPVSVPKCVAAVLENQERMEQVAYDFNDSVVK